MAPLLFYAADTPNNLKVAIALVEMGLPYRVIPIDLDARHQFTPEFLALNPNNKVPVVIDADGPGGAPISIFESGAILQYLGRKTRMLYPTDERRRSEVEQWLFWQMAGLGPMLGQAWHFDARRNAEPYAARRFGDEGRRLGHVLEARLRETKYLGGAEYSIADIAAYPWVATSRRLLDIARGTHPNCRRWLDAVRARPPVRKASAMLHEINKCSMH
ncbi:MAG TPA: glutathione S-transferase N-terminal domain-containing protein [Pseudolabrys sp.]|nr:glutathione S-transferase N-terminal domain-containing protein [Pseudolabrys sp.]